MYRESQKIFATYNYLTLSLLLFSIALVGCTRPNDDGKEPSGVTYNVEYKAGTGGEIFGKTAQKVQEGADGEEVLALAADGYIFDRWSDGKGSARRRDTGVTANLSVTAEFVRVFTANYSATVGGRVNGSCKQTVVENSGVGTVTAVADAGYDFVGWSDGVKTSRRNDFISDGDINVVALFAIKRFTVEYAAEGGHISGETSQTVEYGKNATKVTAVADEGYEFAGWSDGATEPERADTDIRANKTLTARFKIKKFDVAYSATEGGRISGNTAQSVTWNGNAVKVTAERVADNYLFVGWSDGVKELSRTDRNVKGDISVTALFEKITEVKIYYMASAGGSIVGAEVQCVPWGGNAESVTAVADEWYKFVGWSDGVSDATRSDVGVMPNATEIVKEAIFDYDNPPGIDELFTFSLNPGGESYSVKTKSRAIEHIDIPEIYNAKPVTGILDSGFSNASLLESVHIPDSIVRIGRNAFANCKKLASVTGMNNVADIGSNAFANCLALESIVLPANLTKLGISIFRYCPSTVYIRMTEAQMYALNNEWDAFLADGAKVVYIGAAEPVTKIISKPIEL